MKEKPVVRVGQVWQDCDKRFQDPPRMLEVQYVFSDFVKLVNGELSGQRAFMTGKLKFKGSMTAGIKLQKLGII